MADNIKEVGLRFNIDGGVDFQKTIKQIKSEMNLASAEFQKATSAMEKNKNSIEVLTEKQTLYQKQVELQKQKISVLNSELNKLSENEEENADAIKKKKTELAKAETQLNKYEKSLSDVNSKLAISYQENQRLETELKKLGTELEQVKADYDKNISALDKNATETAKLTEKQKLLQSQTDLQGKAVEDLKKQLELETNAEEKNEDAIAKKKLELTKAETELNNYQKELKETSDELSKHSELTDKISTKFKDISTRCNDIGQKMTAVSGGIIAVGTVASKNAMDFESSLNKYIASTGTATEETEKYKQILLDINGNNYGDGYEDIANSMADIKQQMGELANSDNLQSITESALCLRDAFDFEVNESVRAAKMLMDQYGISSEAAFNLIAQGAQEGLNKNGDLLDSINEYSVHFKQLGLSAEDMFSILKYGADSGAFSIDKVGDAIKEMGIRMKDGSATEELKNMGLNAKDLEKSFGKGGDTAKTAFLKIIKGLKDMKDPIKQNQAGVAIFGTMWEDLGAEAILAMTETENVFSATTSTMSETMDKLYSGNVNKAEQATKKIQNALTKLGDIVLPILGDIFDVVGEVADRFSKLDYSTQKIIVTIATVIAAIGPLLLLISSISSGISKLMGLFVAMTNPVVLACTGVVLAVAGIATAVKLSEKDTKDAFSNMGNAASDFISGINTAESHLDNFNSTLFVTAEEQQELQKQMEDVQSGITTICQKASNERRDYTQKEIKQLDEYFEKLRELNQRELEIQQQISNAITQQATTNAENFQGTLEEYKIQSQEWIKTAEEQKTKNIELIEQQSIEEIALLNQRYGEQANMQNEAYATEYNNIMTQKQSKIDAANAEVAEVSQAYANGYLERSKQGEGFYNVISQYNSQLEDENTRHNSVIDSINNNAYLTEAQRQQAIQKENEKHSDKLKDVWKKIYKDMDESQEEQLGVWLANVSQTELYGGQLNDETQGIVNSILESYDSMPKGTRKAMKEAMQPMLEEMEKTEPSLFAKASGIANGILSRLKKAFDIHSPSKKTREIFKNAMLGMEEGVEGEEKNLYGMIDGIAENIIDKLKNININLPNFVTNYNGSDFGISIPKIPYLRRGIANVPYDDYLAYLHQGERILTAEENRAYQRKQENGNTQKNVTYQIILNVDKIENNNKRDAEILAKDLQFYLKKLEEAKGN